LLKYRGDAPGWRSESAAAAAKSHEGRGGSVRTDRSIDTLASTPLSELIPQALAGQRRVWGELQEYDPFAGLCERRPIRLLAALEFERRRGTDVVPLWSTFLYSGARRSDRPKLKALIGRHLLALPNDLLDQLIMPASYWQEAVKEQFYQCDRPGLEALFDCMMESLERLPPSAQLKELAQGEERDWANASYGSAAGHLAEAIIGDPELGR
jgi:hypothetical protein